MTAVLPFLTAGPVFIARVLLFGDLEWALYLGSLFILCNLI